MGMSQTVRIAGIQLSASEDLERNRRRAGEMIDVAASHGARLAALPELWAYPWFIDNAGEPHRQFAEPVTGELIGLLRAKAKQHNLYLIAPFFEHDESTGGYYNSAAVITERGEIAGVYRKMHVPQIPGWEERTHFQPGDKGFPVFETPAGKVGIQLGWDLLFPEGIRSLALQGADLVLAPLAVTSANSDLWQRVALAAAFTNGVWVCRINRVGKEKDIIFAGGSLCAAPTGDLLDEPAAETEGVSLWEIDRRVVPLVRRDWQLLNGRRPDQYTLLVQSPAAGLAEGAVASLDEKTGEQA